MLWLMDTSGRFCLNVCWCTLWSLAAIISSSNAKPIILKGSAECVRMIGLDAEANTASTEGLQKLYLHSHGSGLAVRFTLTFSKMTEPVLDIQRKSKIRAFLADLSVLKPQHTHPCRCFCIFGPTCQARLFLKPFRPKHVWPKLIDNELLSQIFSLRPSRNKRKQKCEMFQFQ